MKNFHPTGNCPVRDVLSRLGDKWSMLVLTTLSVNGHDAFQRHSQDHRRYFTADADRHAPDFGSRRPSAPQSISRSARPAWNTASRNWAQL